TNSKSDDSALWTLILTILVELRLLLVGGNCKGQAVLVGQFALQHVLGEEVPADEAGEFLVGRLLDLGGEAVAGFGVVVLVHGTPLGNVAVKNRRQGDGEPAGFGAEAVVAKGQPAKEIGVDPDGPTPVRIRVDDGLVVVGGVRFGEEV